MPGNPHAGGALASITTMDSVLRDAGWLSDETVGAITVDFFSLDVEEHELEVLLAVPWEKLNIRFVAIENNHATLDEEELFIGKSFVKLGGMGVDDMYVSWVGSRTPPSLLLTTTRHSYQLCSLGTPCQAVVAQCQRG